MAPRDSAEAGRRGPTRVARRDLAAGGWEGLAAEPYKAPDGTWAGVTRTLLAGGRDSGCAFELRYFELAAGGRTSLERHHHQHAVLVLAGHGEVVLAGVAQPVGPGDLVLVGPDQAHQLRNPGSEPFGFLCVVDAVRDRPVVLGDADAAACDLPTGESA